MKITTTAVATSIDQTPFWMVSAPSCGPVSKLRARLLLQDGRQLPGGQHGRQPRGFFRREIAGDFAAIVNRGC